MWRLQNSLCTDPPEITKPPVNTTVTQGGSIILHCQATANPVAGISWKKEHKAVFLTHSPDGKLTINNAEKSDAGKYICIGRNKFDNRNYTAKAAAFVTVKCK